MRYGKIHMYNYFLEDLQILENMLNWSLFFYSEVQVMLESPSVTEPHGSLWVERVKIGYASSKLIGLTLLINIFKR